MGVPTNSHARLSSGVRNFEAAISVNPNFALAYAGRARARRALGDKAGANADLRKAGELKADSIEP